MLCSRHRIYGRISSSIMYVQRLARSHRVHSMKIVDNSLSYDTLSLFRYCWSVAFLIRPHMHFSTTCHTFKMYSAYSLKIVLFKMHACCRHQSNRSLSLPLFKRIQKTTNNINENVQYFSVNIFLLLLFVLLKVHKLLFTCKTFNCQMFSAF